MTPSKVETWVWVFIYAGMLLLGLGLAVSRNGGEFGFAIASFGIFLVVVGIVMIWIRSRMKSSP